MNYERAKSLLSENGQLQLLDYYGELSEEQRRILLNDIEKLNFSVVENINRADGETAGKIPPAPRRKSAISAHTLRNTRKRG